MSFVSLTRIRVRSWRYLPGFFWYAFLSNRQATAAPGILGVDVLNDANMTFWTRSVWTDETAVRAFITSGAHRKAMTRLLEWCDETSVAHWHQESPMPPTWIEAHQRMQREGRTSKVRHPSEAHRRFEIPAPRVPAAR